MKIALLEVESPRKECINKDFMGGYGWAFNAGRSLPARLINYVKKSGEKLPIMSYGYLSGIFSAGAHEVEYRYNSMPTADMVIMQSSMVDHKYELDWARRLRKAGKRVGFIGPFSSAMPELFEKDSDFVITGEPEEAAYRISNGMEPKGIVSSEYIKDLDSLPFPGWDAFPYRTYSYFPAIKETPFLPILSSRGCVYTCNYCPYLVNYKWRQRSADNVLNEIGYLIERYKIKAMLFRDPIFTLDRDRTMEIARGILERGYKVKWACETRLDRLDKEMLDMMRLSGLRVINVGVESRCEDVIEKASRKPIEIKHQEEIIRYCDKIGVRVTVFYMLGMPDDTEETIDRTIRYAKMLNTHVAQFFVFTPFPGTRYFEMVKDRITEPDWEKFDCYTPVLKHEYLTPAKIEELKEYAFVSYYYRPRWAIKLMLRSVSDLVRA